MHFSDSKKCFNLTGTSSTDHLPKNGQRASIMAAGNSAATGNQRKWRRGARPVTVGPGWRGHLRAPAGAPKDLPGLKTPEDPDTWRLQYGGQLLCPQSHLRKEARVPARVRNPAKTSILQTECVTHTAHLRNSGPGNDAKNVTSHRRLFPLTPPHVLVQVARELYARFVLYFSPIDCKTCPSAQVT